jgi:hypothetical protein
LKKYKLPRREKLLAKLIQAGDETLQSEILLFDVRKNCLISEESIIVPIYKKGDKTDCSNY